MEENIKCIEQYIKGLEKLCSKYTQSQSDDFANGLRMCDGIKDEIEQIKKKVN